MAGHTDPSPGTRDPRPQPRGLERGQILIMYALMLPVLIGLVAFGVDTAHLFARKRTMQGAADLAALAGAIDLPDAPAAAEAAALAYAAANGFTDGANGIDVVVVTPYDGDEGKIEVTITQPVGTIFGRVLDADGSVNIRSRAVAERHANQYGIFAMKTGCDGDNELALDWSGSTATIEGAVHSNSGIKVGGSGNTIEGSTTYVCDADISGSGNTFSSGPTQSGTKSPPLSFSASDFPCTYGSTSGDFDINSSGAWWMADGKTLRPGVYCARGKLSLSRSDVIGNVTLVALGSGGKIDLAGSNYNLTPHTKGVLMYSEGTGEDAMKVAGSGGSWTGLLYAPHGRVETSGSSNFSLTGSIVAWTIRLNGSVWGVNVGEEGGGKVRLVE